MNSTPTIDRIAQFLVSARSRKFPAEVVDAAKQSLLDWLGVSIAALSDPGAVATAALARRWNAQGDSILLTGGSTAPAVAALVNGTTSHCLDFDDTHIRSVVHGSAVTWAATLAVGSAHARAQERNEQQLLAAFLAGFEVGTTLGEAGVPMSHGGWHATSVLGRFCAASAASVLLGLDEERIRHALGLAATQAGGLTLSFGTMAKPFHAGKTAMDGVISAELAELGFTGAIDALDDPKAGIFAVLLQTPGSLPNVQSLGEIWQITRNSFKPYASCQLTHAPVDAARYLAPKVQGRAITRVRAFVNPLAVKLAGRTDAATSAQAKFSIAYCVALALRGYTLVPSDFSSESVADPALQALAKRVELVEDPAIDRCAAKLELTFSDGTRLSESIEAASGSLGNPMRWPDLESKFMSLAAPVFGADAAVLLQTIRNFEEPGSLAQLIRLIQQPRASAEPALSGAR